MLGHASADSAAMGSSVEGLVAAPIVVDYSAYRWLSPVAGSVVGENIEVHSVGWSKAAFG
jgi:hypothetical protein